MAGINRKSIYYRAVVPLLSLHILYVIRDRESPTRAPLSKRENEARLRSFCIFYRILKKGSALIFGDHELKVKVTSIVSDDIFM